MSPTVGKCECCGVRPPVGTWPVNGSPHKVCIDCLPAGREMDALVAEKVMRLTGVCRPGCSMCFMHTWPSRYSTDIAAAWEVVEKMGNQEPGLSKNNGRWGCVFFAVNGFNGGNAYADTAPLAICRAALKAVGI